MVLEKRKRDGGFEPWQSAGSSNSYPASTPTASSSQIQANPGLIDGLPPAKKQRQEPIPSPQSTPSYPIASSSQSSVPSKPTPAKKTRHKAGNPDDPPPAPPEKRGAMFKKRCPQNILDRVERVMTQRWDFIPMWHRCVQHLRFTSQVFHGRPKTRRRGIEGGIQGVGIYRECSCPSPSLIRIRRSFISYLVQIYTVTIQQKPSCDCMTFSSPSRTIIHPYLRPRCTERKPL
jgi:hypothetical protein